MILRELFSKIVVDVKSALANVNRFDAALDETSEGLGKVEKKAAELGDGLDEAGKKGRSFGDKIADAFKRGGRAAFNARGKFKDAAKTVVTGIGAAATASIAGSVAAGALTISWAENAQELLNMSKQYQLSTDDIQSFTGALELMGLEADDGLEAIKELRIRMGEAKREGTSPLKEALIDLGISFDAFDKMPIIDQMGLVADRLHEVTDAQTKTALANDVAGEDLIKLLPLLDKQSAAMKELTKRAKDLGLVQSKTTLKAGAALAKSWKGLLAIGKSLSNLVSSKLEPTFTSMIATTLEWVDANRDLITGDVVEFFERLVNVTADFIPVAASAIDSILSIIEMLGGVEGAIVTLVGTMATWKIASAALLGPAGPWIAGLTAVITLMGVLGAKVDAEDARITRLGRKRAKGLAFRRRGDFTSEELRAEGPRGEEVLKLEARRDELVRQRQGIAVGEDIEESRKFFREANKDLLKSGGRDKFAELARLDELFSKQVEAAGKLEDSIDELAKGIDEQISLIGDERTRKAKDDGRAKAAATAKESAEDRKSRERLRELTAIFRRDKATDADKAELRFLVTTLGVEAPEGLLDDADEGKGKGGKGKKKPNQKSIEELVGLGPEGIKTISDLVPTGQGTTINNFNFQTIVQPAKVDIVVNSPEGTSAAAIGQETSERFGRVQADMISADQRELVGQLQG